jgi:inorganic pyrophosphatase
VGPEPPSVLNAYIEITPFDLMKYEVDKVSGYLRVDRPQRSSAQHPTLYGFVPRTYCGDGVSKLAPGATRGDGDPLDICVLSERAITRNGSSCGRGSSAACRWSTAAKPTTRSSACSRTTTWGEARDLRLPHVLIEQLQHYFLTYRLVPGEKPQVDIAMSTAAHAVKVVKAAMDDYVDMLAR